MVPNNSKLSERLAILTQISSVTLTTATTAVTSSYISIAGSTGTGHGSRFGRFMAAYQIGDNGTGAVVVNLLKATDVNGSGAAVVTTNTLSATNADSAVFLIDYNGQLIDTASPWIALQITQTGLTCPVAAVLLASDCRYEPASSFNPSFVQTPTGA